jgi:hypothetical protein
MDANNDISMDFFRSLGKVFYAIAAADGHVKDAEYNKLKELVSDEWLDVDHFEDRFGTDTAFQIEIVFDWLYNEQPDVNTCFQEFVDYKKAHRSLFNDKIKALILKTAGAIAAAFSGVNKAELIMLAKLDMALKE